MTLHFLIGYLGQFGFFAWVLLIGGIAIAVWKLKRWTTRALAIAVILGLFAAFPGRWAWEVQKRVERYETAEAMFQERCKKSGEFIRRTADNVEGILLIKVREGTNFGLQYKMDDPYGHDSSGDEYVKSFLLGRNVNGHLVMDSPVSRGYHYVEAVDPKDGKRYRYTGRIEEPGLTNEHFLKGYTRFVLDKTPATDPSPRYGVTYDDISTREERDFWIAGSSLKVIDLQTHEVMAERIGYMWDPGQGINGGGRSPWLHAAEYACPEFPVDGDRHKFQGEQTRRFVEKTLKPSQGD